MYGKFGMLLITMNIMYGWDLLQVLQFFFSLTKYIDSTGSYRMAELLRSPLCYRSIFES
jgi:hypothetical protein